MSNPGLPKMVNPEQFYEELDNLVKRSHLTYMDAVIHFCQKNDMDIEAAASMLKSNQRIRASIQCEGEELNFLAKTARLPI